MSSNTHNDSPSSRILIGKVGKPYGLNGWVKIHSFTQPIENILKYQPWQINLKGHWRSIEIAQSRKRNNSVTVRFEACETPEDAKPYTNAEIAIERGQLPQLETNEYYWTDLIGLTVINTKEVNLGIVDSMLETGSNDVLVVKNTDVNKEHLIPFLQPDVVLKVDLKNQTILVEWDENF